MKQEQTGIPQIIREKGKGNMDIYLAGNLLKCESWNIPQIIREKGDKNVEIMLAGTEAWGKSESRIEQSMKSHGVNILSSFYYADEWVEKMIPYFKNFLLDSGAFTFLQQGKNVNWEEYIKKYAAFINRNNVKHFFELDIDKIVGYDKMIYYRKMLEDLTGKPVIPVWHKSRGKEKFLEMCEEYDYVSIGGIVSKEITMKEYPVFSYLINEAHKRGAKIHGLGFTNLKGLEKYHFDSVDSTAWVSGNRFGAVYYFDGRTMQKVNKPQGKRLANNGKDVAVHNFKEWVKFCDYAERNL